MAGSVSQTLFTADFNNNGGQPGYGSAVADTAPLPEPATLAMLALGGLAVLRKRRGG